LLETLFLGQLSSCAAFNENDNATDSDGNIQTNDNGLPGNLSGDVVGAGTGVGNPSWVLTSGDGTSTSPTGTPPNPESPFTAENGDIWQFNSGGQTASDFLNSIGFTQQAIDDGADPFDFSDDLADYYENQLNFLRNQGNDEIIEKVYNANFQMLGYRRYKV